MPEWEAVAVPRQRQPIEERAGLDAVVAVRLDVLKRSALLAIQERAAEYVSDETWRLVMHECRGGNCITLATVARRLLEVKNVLGWVGAVATRTFGGGRVAQQLAYELAMNLPVPGIDRATAVARAIQLIGIVCCVSQNRRLSECACFMDLFHAEGKEPTERLLLAAADDWTRLHLAAPAHKRLP